MPSILEDDFKSSESKYCFKPYYNWNAFNTTIIGALKADNMKF